MATNEINNSLIDSLGLQAKEPKKNSDLGRDDFMKLMITQLNNQDPTKPMEGGEFFSQIAQFSSVSGIQDLKNSFNSLASALQSNQALQASAMIGRQVLVPNDFFNTTGKDTFSGVVNIPARLDAMAMNVYGKSGQLIKSVTLGPQPQGEQRIDWDLTDDKGNRVVDGDYAVKMEGVLAGKTYALDSYMADKVESVSVDSSGTDVKLNLSGSRTINLNRVRQIM